MKMKMYMVYLDDGRNVFKVAVPAEDEESARLFVQGNGEVISVKDVTNDYFISASDVSFALEKGGFETVAINFIVRALEQIGIVE